MPKQSPEPPFAKTEQPPAEARDTQPAANTQPGFFDSLFNGGSALTGAADARRGSRLSMREADMESAPLYGRVRDTATAIKIINDNPGLSAKYAEALEMAANGNKERAKKLLRELEQSTPERSPELEQFITSQIDRLKADKPLQNFLNNNAPLPIDQPTAEPIAEADDASVLEPQDLDPTNPLSHKLELAEEFRQIGDIEGARDLLEEVVAKNKLNDALRPYGNYARVALARLDANSNPPLALSEGQPDQPAAPANPEISRLADAKASIEGGYLYRAPSELVSIINNTKSTTEDRLAAKTLLDQVELVLKTKEGFDRLVRPRQAAEDGDSQPSNEDIIAAKRSAIEALAKLYPYNGEVGEAFQIRRDYLQKLADPYEAPANPPAPAAPAPPQPAAALDPKQQQKLLVAAERTKNALKELVQARQRADWAHLSIPDNLSNQEIRDADHAAIRALEALYPDDQTYTSERREAFLAARDKILEMSGPYLNAPTPPAPAALPTAGGLPKTPEQLRARLAALFEEMEPAEAIYNREKKGGLIQNRKRLIKATEDLCKIYKEYAEIAGSLFIADIPGIYINKLKTLEQELEKLNKKGLGRRGYLAATGMKVKTKDMATKALDYVNNGIVDDVSKLRNDSRASLKELGDRALAGAKKLTEYGIKGLDKYDKLSPKAKIAIGVGAAGLSIFTAMVPTIVLRTVSVAAMSRKTYTKHMDKAFEKYKEATVLADARKYFDEHQNKMPKTPNGQAISFEEWIKTQNQGIENVKGKISLADFEKTVQYVDEWAKGLGKSAVMGLLVGVAMPAAIKNLDDIYLAMASMLPDGWADPVKNTFVNMATDLKEVGHATIKGLRNVVPAGLMTNLKVDIPRWAGGNLDYKTLESSKKSLTQLKAYAKELRDKIEEVGRESDSSWKKARLEKELLEFTKGISDTEKYISTLEKINDSTSVASAPAGAGATGAGTGSATSPAGTGTAAAPAATGASASSPASTGQAPATPAPAPVAAPVAPSAVSAPTLPTNFPISSGDNLETLMKSKLDILSDLTPKRQENVIYNFLESSVGKEWMKANGITNMNRIFTGNTINLESLSNAISHMRIDGEAIIEKAKNNANLN